MQLTDWLELLIQVNEQSGGMVPPDIRAVAVLCVTVADGEVPVIVMVKPGRPPRSRKE